MKRKSPAPLTGRAHYAGRFGEQEPALGHKIDQIPRKSILLSKRGPLRVRAAQLKVCNMRGAVTLIHRPTLGAHGA